MATLRSITVADEPAAWTEIGFRVERDRCRIGSVEVLLIGRGDGRGGFRSWTLGDGPWPSTVDGLPTGSSRPDQELAPAVGEAMAPHPNRVTRIDHVVVSTPDVDRTIEALAAAGLSLRRVHEIAGGRRQAFFWLDDVILEVVGPNGRDVAEPLRFFGLALVSADLAATAAHLGDRCTPPKPAVQEGRSIAALVGHPGVSIPLAFMTPHSRHADAAASGPQHVPGATTTAPSS